MKKLLCLVLSLMLLSASVFALAEDTSLTYITDKGEFILGLDDAFPPMGFRDDDNNIIGFDIVEIAPPLDDSLASMYAGRKLLTEGWGIWAKNIGKLKQF